MPFRSALPSQSDSHFVDGFNPSLKPISFANRVRNGVLITVLACAGMAYAHQGGATGIRALSWSAMTAQVEAPAQVENLNVNETRRHQLGQQNVIGGGEKFTPIIFADPNAARPPELNFERSFLSELPEAADRESVERRHDENG